mmetsp:Transcript_27891/g.37254  ORF Transcript_27891/g.37254 Transcript_27891/m.37254 type:complete len:92 (-) Transcript_27891:1095-1370(-)
MRSSMIVAALFAAAVSAKKDTTEPAMVGANIGGWMVLEPWITPSLFYRFLGKTRSEGVGMSQWTFCEALGAKEANKLVKAHWDAWLTEEHI